MGHMIAEMFRTMVEEVGPAAKNGLHKLADTIGKGADIAEQTVKMAGKTDSDGAKLFDGLRDDGGGVPKPGDPVADDPAGLRGQVGGDTGAAARGNDSLPTDGDPVDVVSGQAVMMQVDLDLPGVLPLRLARTHRSSYRTGRLFGPSWASTLDQRLELHGDQAYFAAEDGSILTYPLPGPGDSVLPADGDLWPLARDTAAGRFTVTDPQSGITRVFTPQPGSAPVPGRARVLPIRQIRDRYGNHIDFMYDERQVLVRVQHSGGYQVGVDTDAGRVTCLRVHGETAEYQTELADGQDGLAVARFGYGDSSDLTTVRDSSGRPMTFTYDDHRLTSWTDRTGTSYQYLYDQIGRVIRGHGSDGFLDATFSYDPIGRVTTVTNSLGQATGYHYNRLRQVTSIVDPAGHETRSEWDSRGRLLRRTDPLGNATSYAYDEAGNLTLLTRADGTQIGIRYNAASQPVLLTDADATTWSYVYDESGNLTQATDPTGRSVRYLPGARGALRAVTDPLGNTRTVEANDAGLPTRLTDPLGATESCTYDAFGRIKTVTDEVGGTTELAWSVEGALTWVRHPDGTTEAWTYDAERNVTSYADAAGGITRYEYGRFAALTGSTDPDGARTQFDYDTELRPISVTNPQGLSWSFDYDEAGNLAGETDFNGRRVSYRFDPAGQLIERINGAGQAIRYLRNSLGHVVRQDSDTAITRFEYDHAGRVTLAVNADVRVVLQRDVLGDVVAEITDGEAVESTYDPLGQRLTRITPSGVRSRWSYDAAGQPAALVSRGGSLRFEHDAAGRETVRRLGEHVRLDQQWDALSRLTAQALSVSAAAAAVTPTAPDRLLRARTYAYRPDGYVTGIGGGISGERRFELDPVGRITGVSSRDWAETYTYDAAGNVSRAGLPAQAGGAASGDRQLDGTLVRRAGSVHYEHDAQGRVTRKLMRLLSGGRREWRFTWDAEDRLIRATTPDGATWRYTYDPFGRRVAKTRLAADGSAAEGVEFSWDGPVLAEQTHTDAAGSVTTTWDYHPELPVPIAQHTYAERADAVQQAADERFYAIVTDLVGTPTELVDSRGEIAWQSASTLWGQPLSRPAASADCPLRFPGQYYDPETGLHYNFERYYDPDSACYTAPDPLGLAGGLHPHAYVHNPLIWVDLYGLKGKQGGWTGRLGGWYSQLSPSGSGQQRNHIPAKGSYKLLGGASDLSPSSGPAIRMDTPDHQQVASTGRGPGPDAWRAQQRALLKAGKGTEAIQMDIDDIKSKFGSKYDEAIKEMIKSLPSNKGFQKWIKDNNITVEYCKLG